MYVSEDDVRAICRSLGVREVAMQDVLLQYDDTTESVTEFIRRMKPDRPHWFSIITDDSENEPALFSLSAQGDFVKTHGALAANELLAKHGLMLGKILPAKQENPEDIIKGARNPWDQKAFKGTEAERQAKMASIIKGMGTRAAASLAKSAGVTLTGTPLKL